MKHGKKFLALCLSLLLIMTLLTACGKKENTEDTPETGVEDTVDTNEPNSEGTSEPDAEVDANKPEAEAPTDDKDTETNNKPSGGNANTSNKPSGGNSNTSNKPSGGNGNTSNKPSGGNGNTSNKPSGDNGNTSNKPSGDNGNTTKPEPPAPAPGPTGTPSDLINNIYAQKPVELMLGTVPVDLSNADSVKSYLGLSDGSKVKEAAASEALIGSQAYSLAMVRVKDSKDAAAVAQEMKSGINPRKWVCVEADDLKVAYCGDVVMLIMVQSSMADMVTAAQMVTAFQSVCGTQSVTTV